MRARGYFAWSAVFLVGCGGDIDLGGEPPLHGLVPGEGTSRLALAEEHTCALSDGIVRCWGLNRNGEVGDGTMMPRFSPTVVPGLEGVREITCNGAFDLGAGTRGSHTCARLDDGTVRCWGPNINGQGEQGTTVSRSLSPVHIEGLSNIAQLAAGEWHTCARRTDGAVLCWGDNGSGALGVGTPDRRDTPDFVPDLEGVVELAAGAGFTCARKEDGTVVCWGSNVAGQLGDGTTTDRPWPAPVIGLQRVVRISAIWGGVCALSDEGEIRCWGNNGIGQLFGPAAPQVVPTPTHFGTQKPASDVSAGFQRTCALLVDESVQCLGYDQTPTPLASVGASFVEVNAGGGEHGCAFTTDGALWCWGPNFAGQLGDGTTNEHSGPTQIHW